MIAQDKHAGRTAKCTACGRDLVVPPPPPPVQKVTPRAKRLPPQATTATIIVRRAKRFAGSFRGMTVFIDGRTFGKVESGDEEVCDVSPGTHTVEVGMGDNISRAFDVTLEAGEEAEFECELATGAVTSEIGLRCVRKPSRQAVREASSARPQQDGAGNGGMVLLFGFLSFCVGIFGIAALAGGVAHMQKVSSGQYNSSGVAMAVIGMILGIIGFLANVFVGIMMIGSKVFD